MVLRPPTRSLCLAAALIGATISITVADEPRPAPTEILPSEAGLAAPGPLARHFPNVTLRTQDDREVRFYDDLIRGKLVLINFIYTNCDGICPGSTANLVALQKRLGDRLGRDVFIVSVCIDSARDTPSSMKSYAGHFGTGPGWTFVTGAQEDVDLIRRKLGVYDPDDSRDRERSQHTGMLTCVNDPTGRRIVVPALTRTGLIEDGRQPPGRAQEIRSVLTPRLPPSRGVDTDRPPRTPSEMRYNAMLTLRPYSLVIAVLLLAPRSQA
jgi:protein SCO1/2